MKIRKSIIILLIAIGFIGCSDSKKVTTEVDQVVCIERCIVRLLDQINDTDSLKNDSFVRDSGNICKEIWKDYKCKRVEYK